MENELINWKTNAWKDPGMVSWYHQRMELTAGSNRLKNQVETELLLRWATGPRILDVGVGTGRAAIPLAMTGCQVVGVDSSEAMLAQCRCNAGSLSIDLQPGDVARLDFADAMFDSLVSLNVMVHFPHWQEILKEWVRVVRPGGRIVFDVHSSDHVQSVQGVKPELASVWQTTDGGTAQKDFSAFTNQAGSDQIIAQANALGLTVVAMVPYAGIYSGGNPNYWFHGSRADGSPWERLLSWTGQDERFYPFALSLEQEFFARLTPSATFRMMVVLEKRPGREVNSAWVERRNKLNQALAAGNMERLGGLIPEWDPAWRERLDAHLDYPLCRLALFMMLSAVADMGMDVNLKGIFAPRHGETLERWLLASALDKHVYSLASTWHRAAQYEELMTYKGIPLGAGLEYDMVRALIAAALNSPEEADHA